MAPVECEAVALSQLLGRPMSQLLFPDDHGVLIYQLLIALAGLDLRSSALNLNSIRVDIDIY